VHQLRNYELAADTLKLADMQTKETFYLDMPVVQSDRKQIRRLYEETVLNFKHQLPNVERVKLRAQTYVAPKNAVSSFCSLNYVTSNFRQVKPS
jgi:hypothetical protein